MVHERTEFPDINQNLRFGNRIDLYIYEKFYLKLFNGLFVATNALLEYFENRVGRKCKLMIIPMIVEPNRFDDCKRNDFIKGDYIAYCGSMGLNENGESKDGVAILIEAFSMISKNYSGLRLCLIGEAEQQELMLLKDLIQRKKLEDKVIFTGVVDRHMMPIYLCNARI